MDDTHRPQNLKFYEKPTIIKLTREQAMLKLSAHAEQVDPAAKELLGNCSLMRPRKTPSLMRAKC